MRALFRMAAIAVAGAALYYAGLLNSIVIQRPERPGAVAVVVRSALHSWSSSPRSVAQVAATRRRHRLTSVFIEWSGSLPA